MANITGKLAGYIEITGSGVRNGECNLTVNYLFKVTHAADTSLDFVITDDQMLLNGIIDENGIIHSTDGDVGINFKINVIKHHNTYDFTLNSSFTILTSEMDSQEIVLEKESLSVTVE